VTIGENASMIHGIPDQAEYPAPPIDYLIKKIPSIVVYEKTDFIPEVK